MIDEHTDEILAELLATRKESIHYRRERLSPAVQNESDDKPKASGSSVSCLFDHRRTKGSAMGSSDISTQMLLV